MNNIIRIVLLGLGVFWLALAFSLSNVDSMFIDFTQIPNDQIQAFRFTFYCLFVACIIAIPFVGEY